MTLPTFDQVMELPAHADLRVPEEWIDHNEHMNIRHYIDVASLAALAVMEEAGFDSTYREENRLSLFTVEHHLRYLAEMRLGERLTGHVYPVKLGTKGVHLVVFVLDRERDKLAMVFETVLLHVDMDKRKAVEIPAHVQERALPLFEQAQKLTWSAPLCGVMDVK